MTEFIIDAVKDMAAIEGARADLSSKTDKPSGYPFSNVTVYSTEPLMRKFMPEYDFREASSLESMRKLDFKKAGKYYGSKVQEMKNRLDEVPKEFIITADVFPQTDEFNRKTTGCRKCPAAKRGS